MEDQKYTAESIMALVKQMSTIERTRLQKLLSEPSDRIGIDEFITERRFAGGRVCPICGGTHVQRNGKRKNGKQKFICKDCGKTFSTGKNTVFAGTHKGMETWSEFLNCMSEGLTIAKCAERCGISAKTAFTWRHKVLDAIGEARKDTELTGIVEADETFQPVSYKGCKDKFKESNAERKPRKRGGGNHKKGLSEELVCVPCAVDRNGNAVSKIAKLGKCSAEAVQNALGGHISAESTLCTDKEASYRRFSENNGNGLVQIKGGKKSVRGIFHIQHLNAYHSVLKNFLRRFNGVSSKYLNNYLTWNNVVEHNGGTLREKTERMLQLVASAMFEETWQSVPQRPLLPILVKNQS